MQSSEINMHGSLKKGNKKFCATSESIFYLTYTKPGLLHVHLVQINMERGLKPQRSEGIKKVQPASLLLETRNPKVYHNVVRPNMSKNKSRNRDTPIAMKVCHVVERIEGTEEANGNTSNDECASNVCVKE
jgi:hypothetical protein